MKPNNPDLPVRLISCDSCRFWDRNLSFSGRDRAGFGTCESPTLVKGYNQDEIEAHQALVENDEGWGVITGPKFGCIFWQPMMMGD